MARYPEYEPIYKAFNEFIQLCLIEDKSLLWPDQVVWTPGNVEEVKRRFVDNGIEGSDQLFTQKLLLQMADATPELWMILADIYFIYYLPSNFITPQKKRTGIVWAIEQAKRINPVRSDNIWDALDKGFTFTGQVYHKKFAQFRLILLLALEIKHKSPKQRKEFLEDADKFQALLDTILNNIKEPINRAPDMRRAMLYMAFPELYEPIITKDQGRIINAYQKYLPPSFPEDDDKKLHLIRKALLSDNTKSLKESFKFDDEDIKQYWKDFSPITKNIDTTIEEDEKPEKSSGTIFVSYRRADSGYIVDRIRDELVPKFGIENVFLDVDSIRLGVDFRNRLKEAINGCNVVLVIIGERWLDQKREKRLKEEGDFVRFEIASALQYNKLVIPIFIENVSISDTSKLPPDLENLAWLQGFHLRPYPDFKKDMENLIEKLNSLI